MRKILLPILFMLLLGTVALAHPGSTDSDGGHYNRSTGEYHYHHGYSEHDHADGVCPYEFDDQTNTAYITKSKDTPKKKTFEEYVDEQNERLGRNKEPSIAAKIVRVVLYLFVGMMAILFICGIFSALLESILIPLYHFLKKIVSSDTFKVTVLCLGCFGVLVLIMLYDDGHLEGTFLEPALHVGGLAFRDTLLLLISFCTWLEWFNLDYPLTTYFFIAFISFVLCHIYVAKDIMFIVLLILAGLLFLTLIIAIIKRIFE